MEQGKYKIIDNTLTNGYQGNADKDSTCKEGEGRKHL
jgi:hypothetical protein